MISLYVHTIRHLKWTQIRYQVYYMLRNRWRRRMRFRYPAQRTPLSVNLLHLAPSVERGAQWQPADQTFTWLNKTHTFGNTVNWRFSEYGKLWTYHLHYFEYLTCKNVEVAPALALMRDFISHLPPEANEPYPVSLRLIYWIRFFAKHQLTEPDLDAALYAQAYALLDQPEKHLLGNHYLENGFGLLFAAYRYQDPVLFKAANKILRSELPEQILPDGGHFERSPMYHAILLYRILDAYNLTSHQPDCFEENLSGVLAQYASKMLSWLTQMTFPNGDLALFNDTAQQMAPDTDTLIQYAAQLGIRPTTALPLAESGYTRFEQASFTCIVDIGQIGPDYIPGHAHCDTLSLELYIQNQPFIVDTGISTYEKNQRRQLERSTAAHNTVMVENMEQSAVWGGFRVAQRAYPIVEHLTTNHLIAAHTGYDRYGFRHHRKIEITSNGLDITDTIKTRKVVARGKAYWHFHPSVTIQKSGDNYIETSQARLEFEGAQQIAVLDYDYAPQFNLRLPAKSIRIDFERTLKSRIIITPEAPVVSPTNK